MLVNKVFQVQVVHQAQKERKVIKEEKDRKEIPVCVGQLESEVSLDCLVFLETLVLKANKVQLAQ